MTLTDASPTSENNSASFVPTRTVPGVARSHAGAMIDELGDRLAVLIDLDMTLKHAHWNVVGPNFIAVHEMLDDFVAKVRPMVDAVAERMRTLGGIPMGTPGAVAAARGFEDYPLGEAPTTDHLRALDDVFDHAILGHRRAIAQIGSSDPITEDLLIAQTAELELAQWFIRSFLKGTQPDATASFGVADRAPTESEVAAAGRQPAPSQQTKSAYDEMLDIGTKVRGEGAIS